MHEAHSKNNVTIADCYRILGLKPGTDLESVTRAYRTLSKQFHPDRHGNDQDATLKQQHLNEIYGCLKQHLISPPPEVDPSKERANNRTSSNGSTPRSTSEQTSKRTNEEPDDNDPRPTSALEDLLVEPFVRQIVLDIFPRAFRRFNPVE